MQVKVYWNLHKNIFSIQHNGIVIGYAQNIVLRDVKFKVSQAGREKVLREKRKNVHAFVVGELVSIAAESFQATSKFDLQSCIVDIFPQSTVECVGVTYNPFKYESFVKVGDSSPIFAADKVRLDHRKIFLV